MEELDLQAINSQLSTLFPDSDLNDPRIIAVADNAAMLPPFAKRQVLRIPGINPEQRLAFVTSP
jgi:hypothetical protein